jgi:tetratricopeptide (TPR) repeat protein
MRVISWLVLISALIARAQTPDDSLQKGIAEFNRGQYAAAETWLAKAPDSEQRRTFLALTRAATGRCSDIERALAEQFEKGEDPELRRLAGLAWTQCQISLGHSDNAIPVLTRLKTLYPADADVLYQSARLYMRGWNDALYEMFQKAPGSYRVNQISAEVFEIQNRYQEAAAEYRKAIEKNPAALNLHFRLGRDLLLESHSPENLALARAEFEKELELNPADSVAEYEVGQISLTTQQPAQAMRHFERAAAISPDFAEALQALARLRLEAKQYGESITLLEKVVRLQPANESAHYSLMLVYRDSGRAADAAREQAELDKLQQTPQGEFTDFLKRLGEKAPKQ